MAEFLMPSLGADMTEGTLLDWLVKPGDEVHHGDIVAVVDTSKAEIEIEIFTDGVIGELLVAEGTKVPVGAVLATVLAPGEAPPKPSAPAAPAAAPEPVASEAAAPAPVPAPAAATPPAPTPEPAPVAAAPSRVPEPAFQSPTVEPLPLVHGRPRVSPLARRAAEEAGIDPATIHGSGSEGAVVLADVEHEVHEHPHPPAGVSPAKTPVPRVTPPTRDGSAAARVPAADADERRAAMRRAIGDLMARSKREIPHFQLEQTIDLLAMTEWLADHNAGRPVRERVIPAAVLLAASARAARAVPTFNGFFTDGAPQLADAVHLGVALALRGGGLVAPAIHDADALGVDDLMAALRDLAGRARSGALRGSEMTDATITVTNLGDRGADKVEGVIYPPQLALVGFGRIRERPWAEHGLVGARPTVIATLAADHRAADGHAGSLLLAEIDRLLQVPEELT